MGTGAELVNRPSSLGSFRIVGQSWGEFQRGFEATGFVPSGARGSPVCAGPNGSLPGTLRRSFQLNSFAAIGKRDLGSLRVIYLEALQGASDDTPAGMPMERQLPG